MHTNKGDFDEDTASDALPGPAADRQVTIGAFTHEDPECDEHDEFDDPDGEPYNDTWRVSLRVSIATLGG